MDVLASLGQSAKALLLLAGLLGPGAALMSALRLPRTLATCFAGSAVALFVTVVALQLTALPISLVSLTGGLVLIAAVARGAHAWRGRQSPHLGVTAGAPQADPPEVSGGDAATRQMFPLVLGRWTPLYVLFWVAVAWRAGHQPLPGPDVEFRWSFLAEQMLRVGSLDFYPPRSAGDFVSYFWVESIPPGASALHAWAYACAGSIRTGWTVPGVVLQLWALHELIGRTAFRAAGLHAARLACLAAAACPLLTWAVLLGQETGLTAVSIAGIAFALGAWRETRRPAWAALAGGFALMGASAREYGLVFPALSAAGLVLVRADRRAWWAWAGLAALSLAWPLRTFVLTGNPFYSLSFAGLPTNPRFIAWIEHDAGALGAALRTPDGWRDIIRYVLCFGATALLGWGGALVQAARKDRSALWVTVAVTIVLGLWLASVRYTNGGLFYSMRVTSPALALGALSAGIGAAIFLRNHPRRTAAVSIFLLVLLAFTAPATLALPRNAWTTPWRDWAAFTALAPLPEGESDDTVALLQKAGGLSAGDVVLTDAPGFQRRLLPLGVHAIPLWSPQADALFDPTLPPAEAVRRWRASRVRLLMITRWQVNLDFLNTHSRWARPPFHVQLIGETKLMAVFAIRAAE